MPAAHEKENVGAKQTTLNFAKTDGKKRTLTVKNVELNLDESTIPVTKEVVEAMRKRIIELEDTLANQPPAKRSKTIKATDIEPVAGPSVPPAGVDKAKAKADTKKVDVLIKKFWSSLQKEVKTEKYKFRGGAPKSGRIEQVLEEEEFHAIFDGKGVQTQPTPTNKPTSTVIMKEFTGGDIEELFGKHYKELKGNRYSLGGAAAKGEKIGLTDLDILSLQVTYAKNTMKCAMKFEVEEASGPYDPPRAYGWFLA